MKIESITIRNLRSFSEETVELEDFTSLVGPNGAGKSTVLCALNIFFRASDDVNTDMAILGEEDFHSRETGERIEISITFVALSDEAKLALSHYVRNEKLIVTAHATFNPETGEAVVKHSGERMVIKDFVGYFEADKDGAKADVLKATYAELRADFSELPEETVKAKMESALREYEESHPDLLEAVASEDEFYGSTPASGSLRRFVEWVYIPAVKDAADEGAEGTGVALKKLVARTVAQKSAFAEPIADLVKKAREEYAEILAKQKPALEDLARRLEDRLKLYSHPNARVDLDWKGDPDKSVRAQPPEASVAVGDGDFLGDIARQGHGLQRSYLIALLEILALESGNDGPTLILGCEEPELYQHPPQAKHLAAVLRELATSNAQVLLTTHSPYFVTGTDFEHIRFVRLAEDGGASTVKAATLGAVDTRIREVHGDQTRLVRNRPAGVAAKLNQSLQPTLSEMFFSKRVVFVEGLEDLAYVQAWLTIKQKDEEFRKAGWHIVPTSGKSSMIQPAVVAELLKIPSFLVFDGDRELANRKPESKPKHEADNRALAALAGEVLADPFPVGGVEGVRVQMWENDIGASVEADVVESIGEDATRQILDGVNLEYGQVGDLKKNSLFVGSKLNAYVDAGAECPGLDRLCARLIDG